MKIYAVFRKKHPLTVCIDHNKYPIFTSPFVRVHSPQFLPKYMRIIHDAFKFWVVHTVHLWEMNFA